MTSDEQRLLQYASSQGHQHQYRAVDDPGDGLIGTSKSMASIGDNDDMSCSAVNGSGHHLATHRKSPLAGCCRFPSHACVPSTSRAGSICATLEKTASNSPTTAGIVMGGEVTPRHCRKLSPVYIERVVLKSVLLLGLAFTCVLAPFYCLHYIQTPLFIETGLGTTSLALLYGTGALSCWYAPAFVQHLSPSWAIVVSFVTQAVYVSTFFYPKSFTLFPSAVLAGSTLGPLFSAQTSFLMHLVSRVSALTDGARTGVERRFLRMFYALANCSRVIGTVSLLFMVACTADVQTYERPHSHTVHSEYFNDVNVEAGRVSKGFVMCSSSACPSGRVVRSPPTFSISLSPLVSLFVVSVFLGLVFTGIALVMSLLDKFQMFEYQDPLERAVCGRWLRAVAHSLTESRLRLLLPMAFFSGLQQGVMNADFTQLYISCAPSLYALSFVVLLAAVLHLLTSLVLLSCPGLNRPALVFGTLLLNALMLLLMSSWSPQASEHTAASNPLFFIVSSLWGFCSGVWETLMITYLSGSFEWHWEAPFSAMFMSHFVGMTVAFGASSTLCLSFSLLVLSFVLLAASLPYALLENKHHQDMLAKLTVAHL
ncbi:protein unc-93 homolog A-like [Varroa jacobsoni]|nr:protein unc-93 homolog A-like isoform X2 [Varroa destructor]XP_022709609.1 protein unc-93 homolog A-like [Varroa jacobsoni]